MTTSTAFPQSRVARGVAILTEYVNLGAAGTRYRPARVALYGQGDEAATYTNAKRRVFSAYEVGTLYGFTSPLYLMALSVLPPNGDGVGDIPVWVYPLTVTAGTQAVMDITPTGTQTLTQTYYVKVNNVLSNAITMVSGDTVAEFIAAAITAINGVQGMPGAASDGTTKLDFTAGWEGVSGNEVVLEVVSPDDAEMTFVTAVDTAGAGTLDVEEASSGLNLVGEAWDTHIVTATQYTDSTNLNKYSVWNDGRWLPEVRKPLKVYTGTAEATLATVTAVTDARKSDKTNIIVTNPGSDDLSFVIAADHVRRIATLANANPPHDYGSQKCSRLSPGLDSAQWSSSQRQAAALVGTSTTEVKDGVVEISDIVTCYHPTGEDPPAYRYDVDIEKISTIIYNLNLIFDTSAWNGAPLVPNDQAVKNPTAKKPKMAEAAIYGLIDVLADDAIISDPDFAKENSSAAINGTNPKRLDIEFICKLSGNTNVISINLGFGFYYGGA